MQIVVTTPRKTKEAKVETDEYAVCPMPSDFGRAFKVRELGVCDCLPEASDDGVTHHADCGKDVETYYVCLDGQQSSCDCTGHLRYGKCKHLSAIQALISKGKL